MRQPDFVSRERDCAQASPRELISRMGDARRNKGGLGVSKPNGLLRGRQNQVDQWISFPVFYTQSFSALFIYIGALNTNSIQMYA